MKWPARSPPTWKLLSAIQSNIQLPLCNQIPNDPSGTQLTVCFLCGKLHKAPAVQNGYQMFPQTVVVDSPGGVLSFPELNVRLFKVRLTVPAPPRFANLSAHLHGFTFFFPRGHCSRAFKNWSMSAPASFVDRSAMASSSCRSSSRASSGFSSHRSTKNASCRWVIPSSVFAGLDLGKRGRPPHCKT